MRETGAGIVVGAGDVPGSAPRSKASSRAGGRPPGRHVALARAAERLSRRARVEELADLHPDL